MKMTDRQPTPTDDERTPTPELSQGAGREVPRDTVADEARRPQMAEQAYLPDQAGDQARERWERIQAGFVDDPRRAVGEAHELVGELVQRIVQRFGHERDSLEQQWSSGADVSTEDLRVCLQSYRAFFARLLPTANGSEARGR
jgi:hypothetical protein